MSRDQVPDSKTRHGTACFPTPARIPQDSVVVSDRSVQGATTVLLHVTHSNLKAKFLELRLDLHMTIASVAACRCCRTWPSKIDMRHSTGEDPPGEPHRHIGDVDGTVSRSRVRSPRAFDDRLDWRCW